MGLIKEIENEVVNSKTSLTTVLRKAKVLASILKSDQLKEWVEHELNGYSDKKSVPEYRRWPGGQNVGHFSGPFGSEIKNAPIPILSSFPQVIKNFTKEVVLCQGVKALEALISGGSSTLSFIWPPEMLILVSDKIYQGYNCLSARQDFPSTLVEQTLDTIRNKLLNFILDLKENNPDIVSSEEAIAKVPKGEVKDAVNTYIFGNNNIVASGVNVNQDIYQEITKNDIESLLIYLRKLGVPSDGLRDLKKAIQADGPREKPNQYGPKVIEWFSTATKKVLEGAWNVTLNTAGTLIANAISYYYGWNN